MKKVVLHKDKDGEMQNLPFPKRIAFIVGNEFSERFMYYGMRTILVLYLTRKLSYDNDTATVTYHAWACLSYFCSLFGAIVSDSWLGKFKTIFYFSIIYAIGCLTISLGAMPPMNLPIQAVTILGLVLVAFGTGGIKPCVCAFSGEQFKLPEQAAEVTTFFSMFYFIIYVGSLLSTIVTPLLRQDVKCFEDDDCFSLAWGVPALLMAISVVIFIAFQSSYTMKAPSGNMAVLVSKCIGNGVAQKIRGATTTKKSHWLDYAAEKFDQKLVDDTKILLKILILYIPLPVFWALYDQQGSRWTIQATRMRGDIGDFMLKPDQMQVVNPLLVLIFIPLFDVFVYPILQKIGIKRPLQKMVIGGILGATSFLISGMIELELQKTYPIIPEAGESQLRIFNTFPCDYKFTTNIPDHEEFVVKSLEAFEEKHIPVYTSSHYHYNMTSSECGSIHGKLRLTSATASSFYGLNYSLKEYTDDPSKSRAGDPVLRIIANTKNISEIIIKDFGQTPNMIRYKGYTNDLGLIALSSSTYGIFIKDVKIIEIKLLQGSVSTILIVEDRNGHYDSNLIRITEPNSMHVLWLIPQFAIMTIGEVMFSVTGLHFSFDQAPESMKSVIQSCWLLTVAFGNLIDVIVVKAQIFESQASEFFLFAGLMFVDMSIFMILAWRYKPSWSNNSKKQKDNFDLAKIEGFDNIAFTN